MVSSKTMHRFLLTSISGCKIEKKIRGGVKPKKTKNRVLFVSTDNEKSNRICVLRKVKKAINE